MPIQAGDETGFSTDQSDELRIKGESFSYREDTRMRAPRFFLTRDIKKLSKCGLVFLFCSGLPARVGTHQHGGDLLQRIVERKNLPCEG